ncbi:hypothetical protein GCM10009540_48130 [Streptomyces turgidiscabies]
MDEALAPGGSAARVHPYEWDGCTRAACCPAFPAHVLSVPCNRSALSSFPRTGDGLRELRI